MPRGDGTGPAGMGPMTGRAAGYCAGYSVPGFMNPYGGRFGGGFGRGRGFGWRRWGYPTSAPYGIAPYGAVPYGPSYSAEQETELLRNQAKSLEEQLEQIQKRLNDLETEAKKGSK